MGKEHDLDEMILEVFEEQEEQFYYPVTTQNTARNFVKALHGKGLPYEEVYKEIGEFEHNFSAWRKGLGRVGIGNRMIERINRPLQEVLLSDDEDELTEILAKLNKEKEAKAARPTNDRVPVIVQPPATKEETRASKLLEKMQREKVEEAKRAKDVNGDTDNKTILPDSPKISRTGSSKLPGAELAVSEPGVVDFRSVLKQRTNLEDRGPGDRRSMPVTLDVPSIPQHGGSADRINKLESGNKSGKKQVINNNNRASSEPPEDKNDKDATKNKQNDADKVKPKRDNLGLDLKQSTKKGDKVDEFAKKNDIDKEFESLVNSLGNEPLPPAAHAKKSAPLAALESSESSSDDESETTETSKDENGKKEESEESEEESEESEEESEEEEEESEEISDINENYDSDLDFDNVDLRQGKRLAEEVLRYKLKVCDREGPGYLYIFTDSPQEHPKPRFKVFSSRFPRKRLSQARRFNIDMKMIVAIEVNLRKRALKRTQERLEKFAIEKRDHWYQASREEIVDTVTSVASKYPATDSLC